MDLNRSLATLTTSTVLAITTPAIAENKVPNVSTIESLSEISTEQPNQTLFLFDIDDTVFDSFSQLGSRAWRRYIVKATKEIDPSRNWHDIFTYALAQKHTLKTVETLTSSYVRQLQENGHVVCGFTSRERKQWYDMPQEGVDALTVKQLNSVNVNFNNYSLECIYPYLSWDSEYFEGTFFANIEPKGNYLMQLLKNAPQLPEKIIFIDDKLSQVESVAKTLAELGIEHASYYYTASDAKGKEFNPLIANIQLYYFYQSNGITHLSDQQAKEIADQNPELTAEHYLQETLELVNKEL